MAEIDTIQDYLHLTMSLPTFCNWLTLDLPGSGMKLIDDAAQIYALIYAQD